jgi:hypothetical protein
VMVDGEVIERDAGPLVCPSGTTDLNRDPADGCECVIGIETCNDADDDCDGISDEALVQDCGMTIGACMRGTERCEAGAWVECTAVTAADEVCDGAIDENCDGVVDEGCKCASGAMRDCGIDTGECAVGRQRCLGGTWGEECTGAVGPAEEACNGLDDDCDTNTDEGVTTTFYRDADGDGHGDPLTTEMACSPSGGFTTTMDDCNDGCAVCFTGAGEACDTFDNNCNGTTDEGATSTFYRDADGDGFGSGTTIVACTPPAGYVMPSGDCDDGEMTVYPGATELCNAIDEDCDGVLDESASPACPCMQASNAGHTYLFCALNVPWTVASTSCTTTSGYRLAKIETMAEQDFVWGVVDDVDTDWWIGLRRTMTGSAIAWEDGSALGAYQPWATGEPSSSTALAGVELRDASDGSWALTPATTNSAFICEGGP